MPSRRSAWPTTRSTGSPRRSSPRDINKAFKFAKGLRAGSVWVNTYDGGDITTPFGGYKQSGIGRDKSLHAFDKFTQVKTTWIQLG